MNYQVKDLDVLLEKGNVGIDEVNSLLADPEAKVFNGEIEVKYEVPQKVEIEIKTKGNTNMKIEDVNVVETKGTKDMFWTELYNAKSFPGKLSTNKMEIATKAFPAEATTRPAMSGAIREAVFDLTVAIYDSELLKAVTKINLDTPHLKIPQLVVVSGWATRQVEGSGVQVVQTSGSYTNVEVETQSALFEITNQALQSSAVWSTLVPQKAAEQIGTQLEGKLAAAIQAGSGKVQISGGNASGDPDLTDLANCYVRLFPRRGAKKALVVAPNVYAKLLSINNISGLRDIIHSEADGLYYIDAKVIQSPMMTAAGPIVSGRNSGNYAFVNLGELYVAQFGAVQEVFNPFYAFENNGSALRVSTDVQAGCMSQVNYTISGFTYADYVVNN